MTVPRLFAIAVILAIAAASWMVLGASVVSRTGSMGGMLAEKVGGLWGEQQTQPAPAFTLVRTDAKGRTSFDPLTLESSAVRASFDLDQRRKGLLWYATYAVGFAGDYSVRNDTTAEAKARMVFTFPTPNGIYDGFTVKADGREVPVRYNDGTAIAEFPVRAKSDARVSLGYRTQGLDRWTYSPSSTGVGAIRDFSLVMDTDFEEVDFPEEAISPTSKKATAKGWTLRWNYDSLVSGRPIGLVMPKPMNPGPLASRIAFFAPVSLLFFFASLVLNTATRGLRVHPMNYAFLAAGFFAFHLLFAYLVDRIDINLAFALASVTSVGLCVGYMRLVIGGGPALVEAAVSQFVFLVLFSYSFFFEGFTGLAITLGAVATLAYFMAKTGRVDWEEAFAKPVPVTVSGPAVNMAPCDTV